MTICIGIQVRVQSDMILSIWVSTLRQNDWQLDGGKKPLYSARGAIDILILRFLNEKKKKNYTIIWCFDFAVHQNSSEIIGSLDLFFEMGGTRISKTNNSFDLWHKILKRLKQIMTKTLFHDMAAIEVCNQWEGYVL